MHDALKTYTAKSFDNFAETVAGTELDNLSDEDLVRFYTLLCNASDRVLIDMEARDLVKTFLGAPLLPWAPPEGATPLPTILTRGGEGFDEEEPDPSDELIQSMTRRSGHPAEWQTPAEIIRAGYEAFQSIQRGSRQFEELLQFFAAQSSAGKKGAN